ncbi:acyltransferase [Candidatus Methylacidiphilum fumarolicum]|uniref:Predicted amidohydrolase n=2 Tax=Candidatus Methylacidiphilum fumarolicum TaxID=591154 RepID=I0JWQ9_METFB|nr:carbon-nitrogen hydrolase [Candidatus Methylacidiphilum fumarolicum]MBW6414374.1 carbon-nitrogen hydrolase [Candidatus Methylacidiphilum fumarolicum]TFE67840.1 acyltransferase [Candidatus Methylacidiphilum fumarolicum]TFE72989.1 acyltransferase [Candidatus Methylacidiphilum fumarolicum]TFE75080.1 acyltransferase [Candidatus Methylacidiphilum fumarolicum]TFE76301.1 acyltransferase [Candidatus Methylacidiphilum fumarolicum]
MVRVALIQSIGAVDPTQGLAHHLELISQAKELGAEIICTQELFKTRYFCNRIDSEFFSWAEDINGPTLQCFMEIAKKLNVVLIGSIFEKRAPGLYHNTAIVVDADGSYLGCYRKAHIPDDPGYFEKYYFTAGENDFPVFQTRYARIGVLICWDQWFPEAARIAALKGAQIIFYPTAIGWLVEEKMVFGQDQLTAWLTIQRAHAIANGIFVASINRTGLEGDEKSRCIEFWGRSFLVDPFGRIIKQAGEKEEILVGELDFSLIEKTRINWPFLRDRRIDLYEQITRRYFP